MHLWSKEHLWNRNSSPWPKASHAWIGAGGDSNAGAVETPHGLLAIDAQQYPRLARQFRAAVEAKTGKPVRALINTHCHLDHTAGNIVFADVPILAHDKTLAAMHANLGPKSRRALDRCRTTPPRSRCCSGRICSISCPRTIPAQAWFRQRIGLPDYDTMTIAPPTETFADHFAFHLPDDTLHLDYWGPAHCDGDIVVWLEKAKVAFLGDLLVLRRFPWLGDCDLSGLIDRLARVLTLDVSVVIPGHGLPTDLTQVARFRAHADRIARRRRCGDQKRLVRRGGGARGRAAAIRRYPALCGDWLPHDVRATYRYLRS